MTQLEPTRTCNQCSGTMDLRTGVLPSERGRGGPIDQGAGAQAHPTKTGQYYRCRMDGQHVIEIAAESN